MKIAYIASGVVALGTFSLAPLWIFGLPGQEGTEYGRRWQESLSILLVYPAWWVVNWLVFLVLRKLDAPHQTAYLVGRTVIGVALVVTALTRLCHVLKAMP